MRYIGTSLSSSDLDGSRRVGDGIRSIFCEFVGHGDVRDHREHEVPLRVFWPLVVVFIFVFLQLEVPHTGFFDTDCANRFHERRAVLAIFSHLFIRHAVETFQTVLVNFQRHFVLNRRRVRYRYRKTKR